MNSHPNSAGRTLFTPAVQVGKPRLGKEPQPKPRTKWEHQLGSGTWSPAFPRADPVPLTALHTAWGQDRGPQRPEPRRGEVTGSCRSQSRRSGRCRDVRGGGGAHARTRCRAAHSLLRPHLRPRPTQPFSGAAGTCSRRLAPPSDPDPHRSPPPSGARERSPRLPLTCREKTKVHSFPWNYFETQFPYLHNGDRNRNNYINNQCC